MSLVSCADLVCWLWYTVCGFGSVTLASSRSADLSWLNLGRGITYGTLQIKKVLPGTFHILNLSVYIHTLHTYCTERMSILRRVVVRFLEAIWPKPNRPLYWFHPWRVTPSHCLALRNYPSRKSSQCIISIKLKKGSQY